MIAILVSVFVFALVVIMIICIWFIINRILERKKAFSIKTTSDPIINSTTSSHIKEVNPSQNNLLTTSPVSMDNELSTNNSLITQF